GEDPIGKTIRIRKVPFTVVGTLVPKGQNSSGQDQDDMIIMPITTAKKKVMGGGRANNWQQIGQIMVQARDGRNGNAMDEIESLLRQRHRLQATEDNDFQVRSLEEMAAAQEQATQIMGLLLASIASVSLIVGGIGIMNIMLVSVTERTKEIGLRQAVGAKTNDILSQFLVEAVSLSLLGGCLGIGMGVLASFGISYFAGWTTLVSLPSILAAFFFSALVGVFFGFYPARKAALLDPIEALRYEYPAASTPLSHAGIPKTDTTDIIIGFLFNAIGLAFELQQYLEYLDGTKYPVRIVSNFEVNLAMKQSKPFIALLCVLLMAAPGLYSQELNDRAPKLDTERQHWYSGFTKPYETRYTPPINI